jgi:hypothetical protein
LQEIRVSHHFCQSDRSRRAALPHAKQAALGVLILGSLLAGCAGDNNPPPAQPAFYQSMARADARIDGPTAASMISGYRQNNGLGGISVDPALMALAQQQAQAMATRDKLDHNVIKPLTQRIKASGYPAAMAVENVSADTTRWRKPFQAGAIRRRTAPTCWPRARHAWALQQPMRRGQNIKCSGRSFWPRRMARRVNRLERPFSRRAILKWRRE